MTEDPAAVRVSARRPVVGEWPTHRAKARRAKRARHYFMKRHRAALRQARGKRKKK